MKKFEKIVFSKDIKAITDALFNLYLEGSHYVTEDEIYNLYTLCEPLQYWRGRLDGEVEVEEDG